MCPAQPTVVVVLFYSILVVTALVSVSLFFTLLRENASFLFFLIAKIGSGYFRFFIILHLQY